MQVLKAHKVDEAGCSRMPIVFRFSMWNIVSILGALTVWLVFALLSEADRFFVIVPVGIAIGVLPWLLLSRRNRRLLLDGDGLAAFDWLGRETIKVAFHEIRGVRSSASDAEQSYFEIITDRGNIDLLPLSGRRLILQAIRERPQRHYKKLP